ncbi:MAG TPA: hypothetical protein VF074_10080 [Pyrinomonadaceae bacterium]
MKVKEEEFKQNEESLTDLQLDEEQAQDTKGGDGHKGEFHVESFSWGVTNQSTFGQ